MYISVITTRRNNTRENIVLRDGRRLITMINHLGFVSGLMVCLHLVK